jgi:hypothetical protein
LPELVKIDFRNLKFDHELEKSVCDEEAKKLARMYRDYLLKNVYGWNIKNNQKWTYNLPESIFEGKEKQTL